MIFSAWRRAFAVWRAVSLLATAAAVPCGPWPRNGSNLRLTLSMQIQAARCAGVCSQACHATRSASVAVSYTHLVRLEVGRAFLGRLEDELDAAGQLVLHAGQHFGGGHQDGGMGVVAAGVHHVHFLAQVGACLLYTSRCV